MGASAVFGSIDELPRVEPPEAPRPRPLPVRPGLEASRAPRILVVGVPFAGMGRRLRELGFEIEAVYRIGEACRAMAATEFAMICVNPHVEGDADGIRFVRSVIGQPADAAVDRHWAALRFRYAQTPFIIFPVPGDTQYAVFLSIHRWKLLETDRLAIVAAIRWLWSTGCGALGLLPPDGPIDLFP